MEISYSKELLEKIEKDIKSNWKSKLSIENSKLALLHYKENSKGFNLYSFMLGVAFTHTAILYSKKTLLHLMESKAIPHIGICLGVGLGFGIISGQLFGKNISNSRKCNNLLSKANERLKEI